MYLMTPRLMLRDFEEEDWRGLHAFRRDPEVARYMHWEPETPEQTRDWVLATIPFNLAQPRDSYNFSIVRRADMRIIGWIGFGEPSHPSEDERVYDFGYALEQTTWGQGLMTEALHAVLAFAFADLSADTIYGTCDARNLGSARVMEKAGMRREATFREPYPATGEDVDNYRYAMRRAEWCER